ncbi:MAG TPA: TonB-dependent receptor [Gemmatimonadaceae bacterium]|nr:TonB-dependent receptor [Gemmatimonadaceae bacterium]
MKVSLARRVAPVALLSLLFPGWSSAQDTTVARRLPPVVTVTRDVGRSTLDLPYAISRTRPDSARPGQMHTRLDETLLLLPGVTAANRNNPSQDPRISIRGFGARSAFGVRSIKVLRDGIPLTLPDGQTPVDYLDLESVGSVEVIRGTASALYGNASGGVIDLRSPPPPSDAFAPQVRSWMGSGDLQHFVGVLGGTVHSAFYQANVGRTTSDNFRAHSRQRLTNGFLRAGLTTHATEIALQVMGLDMPTAENPGALTLSRLERDPGAADSLSVVRRARKAVRQLQLGLSARRPLDAGSGAGELSAQLYGGTRALYNPLTFAVVDVARKQYGGGVRATLPVQFGVTHRFTAGVDAQLQNDARRNWGNCDGVGTVTASCPVPAQEKGALQLDQQEIVSSIGPYLRDEVGLGSRVRLNAGVRDDQVRFRVRDHFLADGSDDSGTRTLHAVSPMAGVVVRAAPLASVYANVASAFETPTTTELGNQPDGSGGLNPDLKPQYSTTYEAGLKGVLFSRVQFDAAGFDVEVRDELIPFEIPGSNGRTYYRNAGRTRRNGVEVEASTQLAQLELDGSYTYSHFRFRDFVVDGVQYEGRRIPGIPEHQLQGSATWRLSNLFATVEGVAKSRIFVDDANTAAAAGYGIVNMRLGGVAVLGRPWLSPVLGVQNLFGERYVGTVAINAAGTAATAKYYEPAPGRTWFVGLTVGGGK